MGRTQHHAIVVTSWQKPEEIEVVRAEAVRLFGPLVSPMMPVVVNDGGSFFIAPDGSKEYWPESNDHDKKRAAFIACLETMEARGIYLKWVEVTFGADENQPPAHIVRAGGPT